jgi:hypothetical protein
MVKKFAADPSSSTLQQFYDVTSLLQHLPFSVNLWKVQNIYYDLMKHMEPNKRKELELGDKQALSSASRFEDLGRLLGIKVV